MMPIPANQELFYHSNRGDNIPGQLENNPSGSFSDLFLAGLAALLTPCVFPMIP